MRLTFRDARGLDLEAVDVFGINADGQTELFIGFDPEDLDEAYAELDKCYASSRLES